MENNALSRLERAVDAVVDRVSRSRERERQLSAALTKGREETEKAKAAGFRLENERKQVRKKLDDLIKRLDAVIQESQASAKSADGPEAASDS